MVSFHLLRRWRGGFAVGVRVVVAVDGYVDSWLVLARDR